MFFITPPHSSGKNYDKKSFFASHHWVRYAVTMKTYFFQHCCHKSVILTRKPLFFKSLANIFYHNKNIFTNIHKVQVTIKGILH